jgi:hypothetical protein
MKGLEVVAVDYFRVKNLFNQGAYLGKALEE